MSPLLGEARLTSAIIAGVRARNASTNERGAEARAASAAISLRGTAFIRASSSSRLAANILSRIEAILIVTPVARLFIDRRSGFSAEPPLPHCSRGASARSSRRSEEHTSELQSLAYLVCRLLLEKKKKKIKKNHFEKKKKEKQQKKKYRKKT